MRGYIHSEESHLDDSLKFAHMMKDLYPKVPLFCLGLSMGGLTCYHISLTHRHLFEGSILMAPAFKNVAPKWKIDLFNVLERIIPKKLKIIPQSKARGSKNPAIAAER